MCHLQFLELRRQAVLAPSLVLSLTFPFTYWQFSVISSAIVCNKWRLCWYWTVLSVLCYAPPKKSSPTLSAWCAFTERNNINMNTYLQCGFITLKILLNPIFNSDSLELFLHWFSCHPFSSKEAVLLLVDWHSMKDRWKFAKFLNIVCRLRHCLP